MARANRVTDFTGDLLRLDIKRVRFLKLGIPSFSNVTKATSTVLSCAETRLLKAWAAHRFLHDGNRFRRARRSVPQKFLLPSSAYATVNYSACHFRAGRGFDRGFSLCDPESVPRANVQITAQPPTVIERLCNRQIAPRLESTLQEFPESHDR